jgi:hypothetical protein
MQPKVRDWRKFKKITGTILEMHTLACRCLENESSQESEKFRNGTLPKFGKKYFSVFQMLEQVLKIWAISITFSGERHPE